MLFRNWRQTETFPSLSATEPGAEKRHLQGYAGHLSQDYGTGRFAADQAEAFFLSRSCCCFLHGATWKCPEEPWYS